MVVEHTVAFLERYLQPYLTTRLYSPGLAN